ncbi:MAG: phage integrase SAM-like domain-containing protein, partial [Bacteroidales bacterium]|nr:phage integrase SAM-like domain-containing protein [Bacteroidales bacterium]
MRVHLRQRQQTKKRKISLYLEFYKGTSTKDGKTKIDRDYEYLELYLIANPKNPFDIQHNKETLDLAKSIKAKRELEIKNGQYGFANTIKKRGSFIEYYKTEMNKKIKSTGNYCSWHGMLKHIINFTGGQLSFENIDDEFCKELLDYLQYEAKTKNGEPLKQSSVHCYFSKFKACIWQAVKDKIINTN